MKAEDFVRWWKIDPEAALRWQAERNGFWRGFSFALSIMALIISIWTLLK